MSRRPVREIFPRHSREDLRTVRLRKAPLSVEPDAYRETTTLRHRYVWQDVSLLLRMFEFAPDLPLTIKTEHGLGFPLFSYGSQCLALGMDARRSAYQIA